MITCAELSERMPEVALDRSMWSQAERAHLASCGECRAEWAAVQAGRRLGGDLMLEAPEVTAAIVRRRLGAARTRDRVVRRVAMGLAAAAAVVLTVWAGRRGSDGTPVADSTVIGPPPRPAPATLPVSPPVAAAPRPVAGAEGIEFPELDALDAEGLDSVLQVLEQPLAEAGGGDPDGSDDNGDRALEQALGAREG